MSQPPLPTLWFHVELEKEDTNPCPSFVAEEPGQPSFSEPLKLSDMVMNP